MIKKQTFPPKVVFSMNKNLASLPTKSKEQKQVMQDFTMWLLQMGTLRCQC